MPERGRRQADFRRPCDDLSSKGRSYRPRGPAEPSAWPISRGLPRGPRWPEIVVTPALWLAGNGFWPIGPCWAGALAISSSRRIAALPGAGYFEPFASCEYFAHAVLWTRPVSNGLIDLFMEAQPPGRSKMTWEYISVIPKEVPEGRVLMHNHVRPTTRLGSTGFRAWLDDHVPDNFARCDCNWAPGLVHYARADVAKPSSG